MLATDAVDLVLLAGAEALVRIEAPQAFHQALAAQDLVAAGDAAVKIVGDVEEGAVAVGDAGIEREQVRGHAVLVPRRLAALELLDGARGPDRPMAEQAALEVGAGRDTVVAEVEWQHQVEQD